MLAPQEAGPPGRWRFFDFLNKSGRNVFHEWLEAQNPDVKQRVNALIRNLEKLDRAFERADKVGFLRKPPCKGEKLIELIIKVKNVQYRPIGWYGPEDREITLLLGATEKDDELIPHGACNTAIARKKEVINNRGRICEHRFD